MKKIICIALSLLVLVGCGGKSDTKITTCTLSYDNDGTRTEIKIDLENDGTYVKKQIQNATITVDSDDAFEDLVTTVKGSGYAEKTKDMKGVNYELQEDKSKKSKTENITIDISKISGEDYSLMTNGKVNTSDKEIKVLLDKTVENLEKQGYTCKAK